MNEAKPMKLLILEDDENDIKGFTSTIKARKELELVLATESIYDAIKCIQTNEIEGIIVDIELNDGLGGSGLDFLRELNMLELSLRPLVIVTTKAISDVVHDTARRLKADLIYNKNKRDYTPNIVLNQFIIMRPSLSIRKNKHSVKTVNTETVVERKKRIEDMITEEFNLIGIKHSLKGRQYLFDAIIFLIENSNKSDVYYTNYLKEKYNLRNSSMSTSMQDVINSAWRNTPGEELLEHFTANITYQNGAPTPTQFIHYYVDKIKRNI